MKGSTNRRHILPTYEQVRFVAMDQTITHIKHDFIFDSVTLFMWSHAIQLSFSNTYKNHNDAWKKVQHTKPIFSNAEVVGFSQTNNFCPIYNGN